jgi:type VI secretion system protein ImpL
MIASLRKLLFTRWVRTFMGVMCLAILIWFFGPLIGFGQAHPFDSEIVRIIAIGLLLVLWLVINLVHEVHAARKDKGLTQGIVAGPDPDKIASDEEVATLHATLRQAMADLKKAKLGGKRLYQLPWYMFIGPPGAGKTTALANSGLQFPLADTAGAKAIGGVGGTRNCDWWFTDQAVLIDTAGRYTTQDSNAAVDASAWTGFLRLLKKHRSRQPLNGVLLAISLSDLSELSDAERQAHAHAMRKRVRELSDELGVRIPVYVLFTKADLIAGFVEFFDGMGREEREQVWGMTFPVDRGRDEGGAVAGFSTEFDALLARLNDRMLERVNQETDIQRRRLIYGFPQQVASLRDTAKTFLEEIFRPSRLETRPLLRGVYLTSGTQDGTPIDRLLGTMAGQFGLQRQAVTAFSGAGRSYFLGRLMREVVFGEAGLVSTDPKLEARTRWIYRGAYAGAALVVLGATGFWTASYFGNLELMSRVHEEAVQYNTDYKALADRGAEDVDLPPTLPPLHDLRTIRGGYEQREQSTPIAMTFGLYQGNKLTQASVDAYYRALDRVLLPRLLARLEAQMKAQMDKPDFLYSALKVYLILGRQGPLDADLVDQWLRADLTAEYPGDDDAAGRDALLAHIDAMLERPLPAVPLDGPLVAQVRGVLTAEPLAQYSYSRIMRSKRIRDLPEWTIADNAGPAVGQVFFRRSGKKLNAGVAGAYTWPGYHNVFLPLLPTVTKDIAEDGWVLGLPDRSVTETLAEASRLRRDVLGLYLDDYVRQWDLLIADIAIKPFGNISQGTEELNLLSAPDSPFRDLLQAIDLETYLSRTGATDKAEAGAEKKLQKFGAKLGGFAKTQAKLGLSYEDSQIADILGEAVGSDASTSKKPVNPAVRVDQHFGWIHKFVNGDDSTPSPMEAAISKMGAMYQNLAGVAGAANPNAVLLSKLAGGGGSGGGGGSPDTQLAALSKDLPKPVAAMLQTVSSSGAAVTSSGASAQLQDAWSSKVYPLCREAFNRYPFVGGSSADVPRDDFARLLAPGGLMDGFFNDNLKALVDTSATPWRWQSADHVKLGLQPGTLTEFENAGKIRDALFSAGTDMAVKFELVPAQLDSKLAKVIVDISGQTMVFDHGPPPDAQSFTWPSGGKSGVRVTMIAAAGGHETILQKDGPWALLRLMDAARVIPSGQPDKFQLVFSSPAGNASFVLNASSVRNPFTMSAFRNFRCPAHL